MGRKRVNLNLNKIPPVFNNMVTKLDETVLKITKARIKLEIRIQEFLKMNAELKRRFAMCKGLPGFE